jgi:uncharacterized protein YjcR
MHFLMKGVLSDLSEDKRKAQRELAYEMYVQNYKYQDIADEVGVSLSTIKEK